MTTLFYDSARPNLIPKGARACLYYDGLYKATPAEAARLSAVRWITVLGGAAAAADTGCIDYEQGNAAFDGDALAQWAVARHGMNCRARVYTDLANLPRAYRAVGALPNVVWWLGMLELDGGKPWTVQGILERTQKAGVTLAPGKVWAVQYAGGPTADFDISVLLGSW